MILKTLDTLGPLHGYGIARRIEQISGDKLALKFAEDAPLIAGSFAHRPGDFMLDTGNAGPTIIEDFWAQGLTAGLQQLFRQLRAAGRGGEDHTAVLAAVEAQAGLGVSARHPLNAEKESG